MKATFKNRKIPVKITEAYMHRLYVKNLASLDVLIKGKKEYFDIATKKKFRVLHNFHNLTLYYALTQADLAVLIKKYRTAKRLHEKSLFARMIALTAYEFFEDINTLIGRDLMKDISLAHYNDLVPAFKRINSSFSQLKKKNMSLLRQIRNNSSAHKSLDSLKFLETVYNIDMDGIYILGIDITALLAEMAGGLAEIGKRLVKVIAEMYKMLEELLSEQNKSTSAT